MDTKKLYEKGFEEYPITTVITQNLFFLIYFGIGFIGLLPLKLFNIPIISLLYAIFLIVMLLFVLRKHLCTNCYYYGKRCSTGWGKLSSLMFKERSGNYESGIKLAGITWGLATLMPVIGIIISLILNFTIYELGLILLFISLTPVNFILHKNSCKKCKMRNICPASMVKEKKEM
ncbi:MAG: hypothetical protein DRO93_11945 [Candidatus Thorarchaeota archaeon]|nr:MAG: hypothetical protein DRO93_11945 [Candidatus Thorarchaeota archaeon]